MFVVVVDDTFNKEEGLIIKFETFVLDIITCKEDILEGIEEAFGWKKEKSKD